MQNVDINKEVQRAMMSPTQDQGIVNLLASELKARDAKAKQQIGSLMAGQADPNSIMAQNEKEVENSVRQEIGQKMQARVMQERQAQARQRQALAGIAGQRAPNMRMADGGIVGYAPGSDVEGNNFSRHEFMYGPILKKLGIGPKYDFGGGLNEDFMNRAKRRAAEEKYGPDAAMPVGSGQPIPMLMQKYGSEQVMKYLNEQKRLRDIEGNVAPELREDFEMMKANVESNFDPKMIQDIRRAQTGPDEVEMAEGGIIGFKEGDYVGGITGPMGIFAPGINKGIGFADFLARKGVESLAGLSASAVNRLRQEYEAMQAREMDRPRGDSVSESQMENLEGVLRGAGNLLLGGLPSLAPEPKGRNRTELADRGGAPQARRRPSEFQQGLIDARNANVTDQLNAAQRRINAEQTVSMADVMASPDNNMGISNLLKASTDSPQAQARIGGLSDFLRGMGNENFFEDLSETFNEASRAILPKSSAYAEVPLEDLAPYLERLGAFVSDVRGFPGRVYDEAAGIVGPAVEDFSRGFTGEGPTQQTDEEVAEEIITTAPSTEDADAAAMKGVPQIANPSLRAAIEGTQDAPATAPAPAPTQEAEIETVTSAASAVTQNPTPENTSRFESEIQRLMERRESPMRALSSFLTSFSQARGGSLGQNIGIASTALRAADDALDKQIVALEQLRRADQISERDFGLKERQLQAQKGLLDAQAKYYGNYKDMQVEIANIRAQQGEDVANRRLYQSILDITETLLPNYRMAAMNSLGSDDPSSQEVLTETNRLMQEAIRTKFREAQNYFKLPETDGAGLGADVRSELKTYVGQQ